MRREEINVLLVRAPGTNCDAETIRAFQDLGTSTHDLHTQKVFSEGNLLEYDILVFPGGFSYGDYVRSGAIWAKEFEYRLGEQLETFIETGRPVIGICNGFQVLVEMGFLPGFEGRSTTPEAALANNAHGYQCRWTRVKNMNKGNCKVLNQMEEGAILRLPIAHGEGRFVFHPDKQQEHLEKLYDNDQLILRYVDEDGRFPEGEPWANPNGAFHDIAGICNPEGNVIGLMPHPERAYFGYLMPEWTRRVTPKEYGDGRIFFDSIVKYIRRKF
ncbi:MAG: phosphoribosylformylglycinamidine synthase I [Candidatus Bathyarchaeia archaeon]